MPKDTLTATQKLAAAEADLAKARANLAHLEQDETSEIDDIGGPLASALAAVPAAERRLAKLVAALAAEQLAKRKAAFDVDLDTFVQARPLADDAMLAAISTARAALADVVVKAADISTTIAAVNRSYWTNAGPGSGGELAGSPRIRTSSGSYAHNLQSVDGVSAAPPTAASWLVKLSLEALRKSGEFEIPQGILMAELSSHLLRNTVSPTERAL